MGLTKKEVQDVKDCFTIKTQLHPTLQTIHVKREIRHNLHKNIVRMFSENRQVYLFIFSVLIITY